MKSKHRTATRSPQPLPASLVERAAARAGDKLELELVSNTATKYEIARRAWLRIASGEIEDDEGYQKRSEATMRRARESLVRMSEGANIREEYAQQTGSRF